MEAERVRAEAERVCVEAERECVWRICSKHELLHSQHKTQRLCACEYVADVNR